MVLLAIAAVGYLVIGYGDRRFDQGKVAERSAWQSRASDELSIANAKILELEEKYRQQEQDAADAIAIISSQYQRELQHVQAEKARILAGLRDGSIRLRIPDAAAESTAGSAPAQTGTSACGCDGSARAELPLAAGEFLVGLASEADEVARQLGKCQAIIKSDRGISSGR